MNVSGCALAKACTGPGMVAMGTNALEMNENGTARMLSPCAAWALPLTRPSHANTIAKPARTPRAGPSASMTSGTVVCMRKPMMKPTPSVTNPTITISAASAMARPASTGAVGDGQ